MIWSVSTLSPNRQARPRSTVISSLPPGGGRSGWGGTSSSSYRHRPHHLAGVRDLARDGAGGRDGGVGQVHERPGVAHAAREVAVGGREADLALAQHPHV